MRGVKGPRLVQFNVSIPPDLRDELDGLAEATGESLRDIVRRALSDYLERYRRAEDLDSYIARVEAKSA